jgi:ankyrin repeat protein
MDRIWVRSGQEDRAIVQRILSWLCHARKQMTIREIQEAVSVQRGDRDLEREDFLDPGSIVEMCCGLVMHHEPSGSIQFTHYTVHEFLLLRFHQHLSPPLDLAVICLTYLTFDVFEKGPCPDSASLHDRLREYAFSGHAARHWDEYIRASNDKNLDAQTASLVMKLVESDAKRSSMLQLQNQFHLALDVPLYRSQTALHVIAKAGIVTIWEQLNESKCPFFRAHNLETNFSAVDEPIRGVEIISATTKDREGRNALHLAAFAGRAKMVTMLCKGCHDVDAIDDDKRSPLHLAAWNGHEDVVRVLLKFGTQIFCKDKDGRTALHLAAVMGHIAVVKVLVESLGLSECGGNVADIDGNLPWNLAAMNGHLEVVEWLLSNGAGSIDSYHGRTALHLAAWQGYDEIVRLLLEQGAGVHDKYYYGRTALHIASWQGQTRIVRILLENGANVKEKDEDGRTSLHLSAGRGCTHAVTILLEEGANVADKDEVGRTPLHLAARNGEVEIAELLLAKEAGIELQDAVGKTPLDLARRSKSRQSAIVSTLVRAQISNLENQQFSKAEFTMKKLSLLQIMQGTSPEGLTRNLSLASPPTYPWHGQRVSLQEINDKYELMLQPPWLGRGLFSIVYEV